MMPQRGKPTGARTRLFLVRHGETLWHDENRYSGAMSDIDLTEKGREQAHRLAVWAQQRRFARSSGRPYGGSWRPRRRPHNASV
jgi:Histidine phosphatase superfamily (branch 1)